MAFSAVSGGIAFTDVVFMKEAASLHIQVQTGFFGS